MNSTLRRAFSFVIMLSLVFVSGCGDGHKSNSINKDIAKNNINDIVNDTSKETITDSIGSILDIPDRDENTTIASVYAVAVPFIVALELSEQVLAVNVKSTFWTDTDVHLAAAGTVGRGTVDLEALAKYAPGVLIHRSNDLATVDAVTSKLGIDVLCITVESFEDIKYTLTMLGQYFGKEERASEVCMWLDSKFKMIDTIVADISEDERSTALMLGGEPGRIAGGDMLQSWMIEKAGGRCVASALSENRGWVDAGVETIFEWNPEFIFCTSSTPLDYSIQSLLSASAWSAVTAVIDENVFLLPSSIDSWDMPGISCAIGTMFMLNKMYPEYFSIEQLECEVEEYYTFMFGKTFESSYLGYDLEDHD